MTFVKTFWATSMFLLDKRINFYVEKSKAKITSCALSAQPTEKYAKFVALVSFDGNPLKEEDDNDKHTK